MSKYLSEIKEVFEFDGDRVHVTLSPILFKDTMRFSGIEVSDGAVDAPALIELFAEILPNYVTSFTGLTDARGQAVAIQQVCSVSYFSPLLLEIGATLVKSGTPPNPKRAGEQSE